MLASDFETGYYVTAELYINDAVDIEVALKALDELCQATQQEPGCTIFILHQDVEEPRRLLLWERYDDEAAFRCHFDQSHTQSYLALGYTSVKQYFQTDLVV